jgi:hypothetical protein
MMLHRNHYRIPLDRRLRRSRTMNAHTSPDRPVPFRAPSGAPIAAPLPGQSGYQWGGAMPIYPFASFGKRLLAALLDTAIILALMCAPLILGIVMTLNGTEATTHPDGMSTSTVTNGGLLAGGIVLIVVSVSLALLYEPLLTARTGAQRPDARQTGARHPNH